MRGGVQKTDQKKKKGGDVSKVHGLKKQQNQAGLMGPISTDGKGESVCQDEAKTGKKNSERLDGHSFERLATSESTRGEIVHENGPNHNCG